MGVDEDAAQALDPKVLDEPHAAHVCREVVDFDGPLTGANGILVIAQIHAQAFDTRHALIPFGNVVAAVGLTIIMPPH